MFWCFNNIDQYYNQSCVSQPTGVTAVHSTPLHVVIQQRPYQNWVFNQYVTELWINPLYDFCCVIPKEKRAETCYKYIALCPALTGRYCMANYAFDVNTNIFLHFQCCNHCVRGIYRSNRDVCQEKAISWRLNIVMVTRQTFGTLSFEQKHNISR